MHPSSIHFLLGNGANLKGLGCFQDVIFGDGCLLLFVGVFGRRGIKGYLKTFRWLKTLFNDFISHLFS